MFNTLKGRQFAEDVLTTFCSYFSSSSYKFRISIKVLHVNIFRNQPLPPLCVQMHDDVIKWKHFPCYWPCVWRISRSPVNSPHKGEWCGALMYSLICVWINGWVNNREACDLRRYRAHYGVTVMRHTVLDNQQAPILVTTKLDTLCFICLWWKMPYRATTWYDKPDVPISWWPNWRLVSFG